MPKCDFNKVAMPLSRQWEFELSNTNFFRFHSEGTGWKSSTYAMSSTRVYMEDINFSQFMKEMKNWDFRILA